MTEIDRAPDAKAVTALVIPGHDCAATIERCLEAVVPLLGTGCISEIVFVNDHCLDDTLQRVRRFRDVRVIESPARGAAAARNAGWRAARAEWIWFVDADCVVEADALARLAERARVLGADAVGGSYANLRAGHLLAELIHEEMVARHQSMTAEVTFAITANLLCRKSVLEQLQGFDESLLLAQDLDLAYRIADAGYRLGFDATSRVGHFHETRALAYFVKQARQGYWRMQLYAKHPGRASGDSYSGPLDYAQPPLSVLGATSLVLGVAARQRLLGRMGSFVGGSSLLLLLLLQGPRTLELVRRTGSLRFLAYAPMGMLRAGFRGVGMSVGIAALGRRMLQQMYRAAR